MAANNEKSGLENTRDVSVSQVYLVENEEHPGTEGEVGPATISACTPSVKESELVNLGQKTRLPKRVIHFSDGIVEEYSTDEEDGADTTPPGPVVDPKTLTWMPYLWYYILHGSSRTLAACDFMGEKLAYFLGITSPKYQYAINEYNRLIEEDKNDLENLEKRRDHQRQRVAEKEADRVFAKSNVNTANPALATDL